jgi:hypothetical protein
MDLRARVLTACRKTTVVVPQALGVLHRPPPLTEPLRPTQQPPVLREARLDPQSVCELMRLRIQCRGGVAGLVGIDADHDHEDVPFLETGETDRGRHSDFQPGSITPLSSQATAGAAPSHKPPASQRANPRIGSRNLTSEPGTTPPAGYDQ